MSKLQQKFSVEWSLFKIIYSHTAIGTPVMVSIFMTHSVWQFMCISEPWPLKIRIIHFQTATEIFGTTRKTLMCYGTVYGQWSAKTGCNTRPTLTPTGTPQNNPANKPATDGGGRHFCYKCAITAGKAEDCVSSLCFGDCATIEYGVSGGERGPSFSQIRLCAPITFSDGKRCFIFTLSLWRKINNFWIWNWH